MPEAAPIAKKRGRPKKVVPSGPAVDFDFPKAGSPIFPPIDWSKQQVFQLSSDLLRIIITARQGKANATAAKDAYTMAKQLHDYVYEGVPEPVELPSKNLSAENLNALEWDPNDDGA